MNNTHPELNHPWNLQDIVHAVKLSHFLQERLLCLPEINRHSPCYTARNILLLYTKIKYLETFPPQEITKYAMTGDQENEEVSLLLQIKKSSSNGEVFSRLALHMGIPNHGEKWQEILKFITWAFPFAEQTETLLTRGSDERSVLNPMTKTNKYNGSTFPWTCDIPRASCTSSSISMEMFQRCEQLRQKCLLNALSMNPNSQSSIEFLDVKMKDIRDRLATCLGIKELVFGQEKQAQILLTPSGTDAELLATSAALARLFSLSSTSSLMNSNTTQCGKVTSIICAQGEIGRGSSSASGGKHFSELTPSGKPAILGEAISKYPSELVDIIEFDGRNAKGKINCFHEQIAQTIDTILLGTKNVVLLHVVMGSKTGYSCPSMDLVDQLTTKYPNQLMIVVDACQMRLDIEAFHELTAKGYLTLVTGSKFFGGAPFCGAILMPNRCILDMETIAMDEFTQEICLPFGLRDYFSQHEFPQINAFKNVRERMGNFMNVGLLLRWESALVNMEPYCQIPYEKIKEITKLYIDSCKQMIQEKYSSMIQILKDNDDIDNDDGIGIGIDKLSNNNTIIKPMESIVSIKIFDHINEKKFLCVNRLKDLHTLLCKDLSSVLHAEDDLIASKRCLLGQPVQLSKQPGDAVIRIALGADMVNKIYYKNESIERFIMEDTTIIQKIQLILQNWDLLCEKFILSATLVPKIEAQKPLRDWNFSVKKSQITRVVQQMIDDQLLMGETSTSDGPLKLAVVYDLDAIDLAFQSLMTSFPSHFEHRFAMKSCPLAFFIKRAIENDVGVECASIIEVQHALRLGCAPHKIVYDSPCKTRNDIIFALNAGVEVNADNFEELEIISEYAKELFQSNFPECTPRFAGELSRIGLRVNPLLGAGKNEYLSVSTVHSKFGIPLTDTNRVKIINFFCENPWMVGLHCHVGSQGCSLEMMAKGAQMISELANEIDQAVGTSRIKVLNIGGGLPSNYDTDDVSPTFAEYVDVLRQEAPLLFERNGRMVLTEYGRSISAKTGWTISEVEYVKKHEDEELQQTAIIHAGSDLFLRTCYKPDLFPHRLSIYKSDGSVSVAPVIKQNVAGPLCFGGDMIGRSIMLPKIERGDFMVIHDSGANTISMFSRHCSRAAPAVYGYREQDQCIQLVLLKPAETPEDVMRFWG
jgi:diaminopimelate decarboxylase